jgi:hypothetical protein
MAKHLNSDGLGSKGLSAQAFAFRHGLSVRYVISLCKRGRLFPARKHPFTKQWWIYPPLVMLDAP